MDKVLAILIGWPVAFLILRFRRQVKEFTGAIGFAERYLGMGGTNTFIVLLGLGILVLTLMYAMGTFQAIFESTLGNFF